MNELALKTEQINSLTDGKLKVKLRGICTALRDSETSSWLAVTRLADIVNGDLYVTDFGTMDALAEFMGYATSYVRKMVKVASLHENEIFKGVTVSKACEFASLEPNQIEIAVKMLLMEFPTLADATVKAIRQVVAEVRKVDREATAEAAEAETEAAEAAEVEAETEAAEAAEVEAETEAAEVERTINLHQLKTILINVGCDASFAEEIIDKIVKGEYRY